jgi:hypothetical protein
VIERWSRTAEVRGSPPLSSTQFFSDLPLAAAQVPPAGEAKRGGGHVERIIGLCGRAQNVAIPHAKHLLRGELEPAGVGVRAFSHRRGSARAHDGTRPMCCAIHGRDRHLEDGFGKCQNRRLKLSRSKRRGPHGHHEQQGYGGGFETTGLQFILEKAESQALA